MISYYFWPTTKRTGPEPVTPNHEKTSRKTTDVHRVRSLALFGVPVDDREADQTGVVLGAVQKSVGATSEISSVELGASLQ
jgi:hypothetical protein